MKYSHRFFLYAPVTAIVLLAIAVCAYWYVGAQAFEKRLDVLNGHQVAPGVRLQFASRSIGGFPFRIDAHLEKLRIEVATPNGPATWQTAHFVLHMLDYDRLQFVFEAAGKQHLSWHDKTGQTHEINFTPALLRASAMDGKGKLARFDLELYDAATPLLSVAHSEFHMRRDPKSDRLDIVFMADKLHLASKERTALGDVIARLRLRAALTPADAWNAFLSGHSDWHKAAESWRSHKGTLDIAQLEVAWGKADAHGKGVLTLDAAHRPEGLLNLRIEGYQGLADEAARRGLKQGTQKGILAGLMTTAAQTQADPASALPTTLAFKNGIAFVNQTPAGFADPLY